MYSQLAALGEAQIFPVPFHRLTDTLGVTKGLGCRKDKHAVTHKPSFSNRRLPLPSCLSDSGVFRASLRQS